MSVEQAEKLRLIWDYLRIPQPSIRKKILIGVVFIALYGLATWYLVPILGKMVVTLTLVPAIGFIFFFGFWGYLIFFLVYWLSYFFGFLVILFFWIFGE